VNVFFKGLGREKKSQKERGGDPGGGKTPAIRKGPAARQARRGRYNRVGERGGEVKGRDKKVVV